VVEEGSLSAITGSSASTPVAAAKALIRKGVLTKFQAGQLLAGKYRGLRFDRLKILDKIGAGGMGTVFLCEHLGLRKKVAVKVLPPDQAGDEGTRERFFREARAAAALDHPNIVRVHDMASSGGVHYIVMEYVEGQDLQSVLNKYGAMPYSRACTYIAQAALGLQHAHEKGLVHRDIKPANLLVDKEGVVKILDLGLATFNSDSGEKDNLTARFDKGAVLGTADFMAPEQVLESSKVDIRADIYSLGVTLYTLINGKPPYSGSCTQKLVGHTTIKATSLTEIRREIPKALSGVVDKMMAKDPAQRYQMPAEVVDALNPWLEADTLPLDGQQTRKMPGTGKIRLGRLTVSKKSKVPIIVAAVAVSALVFGGLGAWALSGGDDTPSANASNDPGRPSAVNPGSKAKGNGSTAAPSQTPIARGEARLVYDIDFAKVSPFFAKYDNKQRLSMDGEYPPGWTTQSWREGARAEVGVQEHAGSRGVAVITTHGDGASAELQTVIGSSPFQLAPGKRYLLRTEYANIGTHTGSFEVRFDAEHPPVKNAAPLKPTSGQWQTADLKLTAPPHQKATIYFTHHEGMFPDYLVVRSVQVFEFGEGATTAPAAPRLAYEEDFGKEPSFHGTMPQVGKLDMDTGRLPELWHAFVWKKGAAGEIGQEEFVGKKGIAIRTTEGEACAEVCSHINGASKATIRAGHRYRVEVEYGAPGTAGGRFDVRFDDFGKPGNDQAKLPPTGLAWKTASCDFAAPPDKDRGLALYLVNYGAGQQNTLFVHTVRLIDLNPDPNASAAPAPGIVVYQTNFGSLSTAKVKKRGFGTVEETGTFPAAIESGAWKEETVMELAIEPEGNSKVLTLRNLEGQGTAMAFLTDVPGRSGTSYWVTVEYQCAAASAGIVRVLPNNSKVRDVGRLSGTGGEWKRTELQYRLEEGEGEGVRLEIHAYGEGAANGLRVRSVTVVAGGPLAAGPAPGNALFRHSATDLKPFRLPLADGRHATSNDVSDIPPGVIVGIWKKEDTAEVAIEDVGGRRAISLTNGDDSVSVQYFFNEPIANVTAGQEYTLRVVHWGAAGSGGGAQLRKPGTTDSFVNHKCGPTNGQWVETTARFKAPETGPIYLYLQNGSGGADAKVAIQTVELIANNAPAAPAAAAPGYRLDLANAKPFAHRYKKEARVDAQGDGSLPAPWAAHTVQAETLADVFVETVGGSPALGLRNHEGTPSLELFAKSGLLTAKAGKKYTVRVTYQTEANGKGGCQVLVNGEEAGGTAFAPSVGAWKDVELTVAATADGPLTMVIACGSVGSEASLYVKAIEIKEVP
jgi:serine/threonine protein kinase